LLLTFLTFSVTKCRKCPTIHILLFVLYLDVCLDPVAALTFSHTESVDNLVKWPPPSCNNILHIQYTKWCVLYAGTSFCFTTSCYSENCWKKRETYICDFKCFTDCGDVHLLQMPNSHKCIVCKIFPISDITSKNYTFENVPNFAWNVFFV
jgi:hypothetical protein